MGSEQLRTIQRTGDPRVEHLLERAFHRAGRESLLVSELARAHPAFDPELALVLEQAVQPVACAVLLPRILLLRGARVSLAACGPIGTAPEARGRGLASRLLTEGLARATARGARGAVALGVPELFGGLGFASAFDLHGLRVPAELLPSATAEAWRGLRGEDLPGLIELHAHSYRAVSGAEERSGEAIEWESIAPRAHTLVHPGTERPLAYLRFRVREELELLECGVDSQAGTDAVLAMLSRLVREHSRLGLRARLPEPHPVARALFHRGALLERSHLGGAAMLAVSDWPGILRDLAPVLRPLLHGLAEPQLSLGVGERSWRLRHGAGEELEVTPGQHPGAHLCLPAELAPALLCGQRGFDELWFDDVVRERSNLTEALRRRLSAHLGPHPSMWCYGPLYELADD